MTRAAGGTRMPNLLDIAGADAETTQRLERGLEQVREAFDARLASDLDCVRGLCDHVERYRGKMLRPTLTLLCGLACGREPEREHVVLGAVVEMIHMATLVHDDVLDDADIRRKGRTVNALSGNETAVILGDYLISSAFHLCSTLDRPGVSRRIGEVTTTLCEGELLQLSSRDDADLNEATYFDIITRKTASLIGIACELGAWASGASAGTQQLLRSFGLDVGAAFQIQDDLLDLLGEESVVGKSLRKDLEKGKLTLPLIRHFKGLDPEARAEALREAQAMARAGRVGPLIERLEASGAIEHANRSARDLAERAQRRLADLEDSPARDLLSRLAEASVQRRF